MTNGWLIINWRPDREDLIIGDAVVRIPHKAKRRLTVSIKAPDSVKVFRRRHDA